MILALSVAPCDIQLSPRDVPLGGSHLFRHAPTANFLTVLLDENDIRYEIHTPVTFFYILILLKITLLENWECATILHGVHNGTMIVITSTSTPGYPFDGRWLCSRRCAVTSVWASFPFEHDFPVNEDLPWYMNTTTAFDTCASLLHDRNASRREIVFALIVPWIRFVSYALRSDWL